MVIAKPHTSSAPSEDYLYPDEIDGVNKVSEAPLEQFRKNFGHRIADEVIALTTARRARPRDT